MKLRQPREATPLSVWIAFVLLAVGTAIYFAGLVVIDDITAFIYNKK